MLLQTDPIQYLLKARPKIKKGKGRNPEISRILFQLGSPEKAFRSVHVAGTNGKGSVSTKVSKSLQLAGYSVGLFTSPHIESLTERIQINERPVSEAFIAKSMDKIHAISRAPLHFFEYMFIIACLYFVEKSVDIAVVEVGIGGKCDTTNCLDTIAAVITSIGYDHKELLGESLHEIAEQKAGIIKEGVPLILGPTADFPCMHIHRAIVSHVEPQGNYLDDNTAVARATLLSLKSSGMTISKSVIEEGLQSLPPCRFERRGKLIFDIAHNPPAIEALLQLTPNANAAVVGFSKTKDIRGMLLELKKKIDVLIIAPKLHDLLEDPETVAGASFAVGFTNVHKARDEDHLGEIIDQIEGELIVCGSVYIMGAQIPQTC